MVRKYKKKSNELAETYIASVIALAGSEISAHMKSYDVQNAIDMASAALGKVLDEERLSLLIGKLLLSNAPLNHTIASDLATHVRNQLHAYSKNTITLPDLPTANNEEN